MIESIIRWFEAAKPQPDAIDAVVQTGCHIEEFAEMCQALEFITLHTKAENLASNLKTHPDIFAPQMQQLNPAQRATLLDALCDQIVTAVGVAHMMGFDIAGALSEVNRSNWSKFDQAGKPTFNEQGKIAKGEHYSPPDLNPFI